MRMYDIIQKKRDGLELSDKEISFFVQGITSGEIPDYQTAALLMAIYLGGMTDRETTALTIGMARSGRQPELSSIDGITVDKHSTGGVGDKTTLVVAPIVAACGGKIAKMSGRGLGFTGGTADKLESFKGLRLTLSTDEFARQVNEIGLCIVSQSNVLAPADKKLYALRDVTATVESIPLIASSIMSKKLAAGASAIVLDVKTGSGALMKSLAESRRLASTMVNIGRNAGRHMAAVISNMDVPLGTAVGNILEVKEAIDALKGNGPQDLTKLCYTISALMLMAVHNKSFDDCFAMAENSVKNGAALNKLKQMITAQGADASPIENSDLFETAEYSDTLTAPADGYISAMDTEKIGIASCILGAGREVRGGTIDMTAGIIISAKTGAFVRKGDRIATLYSNDKNKLKQAKEIYANALSYSSDKVEPPELIFEILQ